jgi:hypothetical protein
MLRIGSMNMQLHGIEDANLTYRDSLAEGANGGEARCLFADPRQPALCRLARLRNDVQGPAEGP